MKALKFRIVVFSVITLLFAACTSNPATKDVNESAESKSETVSESVSYTEAKNYFLRNDVEGEVPAKIDSQADFEKYFGMAAFMGEGGQPTVIDFESQFVIAVVLPDTNHNVEIQCKQLTEEADALVLSYSVTIDEEENSWIQTPIKLIIVDRKFEKPSVVLNKIS